MQLHFSHVCVNCLLTQKGFYRCLFSDASFLWINNWKQVCRTNALIAISYIMTSCVFEGTCMFRDKRGFNYYYIRKGEEGHKRFYENTLWYVFEDHYHSSFGSILDKSTHITVCWCFRHRTLLVWSHFWWEMSRCVLKAMPSSMNDEMNESLSSSQ